MAADGAELPNVPNLHFKQPESGGDRHTSATCLSDLRCAVAGVRRCGSSVFGTEGAVQQRCRRSPGKGSDEEERRRQNGIPELPDGRLASKTTDSCFPLIYLQQEDTVKKRESERESRCVVPNAERSATSSLLLCPVCLLLLQHRDLRSVRRRAASVCVWPRTVRTDPAEQELITRSEYRSEKHRSSAHSSTSRIRWCRCCARVCVS